MWMMDCGSNNNMANGNHEINTSHHHDSSSSLINQRLKRLIPKPTTFPTHKNPPINFSIPTQHHEHLLTFNQHLAERYKKDVESQHQLYASAKTRWNPTSAQLHALENIYRHGTRTPSSEQIQQIANQLRQYGEIEGKNVFYWFQNHKARERQKRRRVSESSSAKNCLVNVLEDQQTDVADDIPYSELRRTSLEVGQTNNNWSLPNSNFTTHSEEPVLIHRDAAAVLVVKSKSADGWIELEDRESPQRRKHVREKLTMEEKISIRRKKITSTTNYHDYEINQSQTLELFPLRSDDELNCVRENHSLSITNFTTPIQFFEFL